MTRTAAKPVYDPRPDAPTNTTAAKKHWLIAQPDAPAADRSRPFEMLRLDQLVVSPFNARTHAADIDATGALEASIARVGVLQPLLVHPLADQAGMFGVFAGQRRLLASQRVEARSKGAIAFLLPCVVLDLPEGELLTLSTAENLLRRDLRDYELYAAVRHAHEKGEDVAAIAAELGQEAVTIRRWLALANLAPEIFAAFVDERISVDQAKAYAATEDHALQLAAWERLQHAHDWEHKPANIRAALGVSDAQAARLLRFVGENAYRDAGGRYELDLFADTAEQRGRVVDGDVLQGLAQDKLGRLRENIRCAVARPDLRFVPQPPRDDYGTAWGLKITAAGKGDALTLPSGDIVAHIEIAESGEPEVTYWWASKAAKGGKEPRRPSPRARSEGSAIASGGGYDATAAQDANAAIKEAEGLTLNGIEVCRSLRREALRAMLVDHARRVLLAGVAGDYLVWAQLRMLLNIDRPEQTGLSRLSQPSPPPLNAADVVRTHVEGTLAHSFFEDARAELSREPFLKEKKADASFRLYLDAPKLVKDLAVAVVVGLTLERSLDADGYRIPAHDALALALHGGGGGGAGNMVDNAVTHWVPPGEAFLGLLPSAALLSLADPWIERVTAGKWQRLKRNELVRAVADLLAGASQAYRTAGAKVAAKQWFHPLLRFGAADRPLADAVARDLAV